MSDAQITPKDNGPILVSGTFTLTDAEGGNYVTEQSIIALCRCGASQNKPFCDGSHSGIGFESACRAS